MNAHDRLLAALSHEKPDCVPTFSQTLEQGFLKAYDQEVELQDDYGFADVQLMVAKELGFDAHWVHFGFSQAPERGKPEIPLDLRPQMEKYVIGDGGEIFGKNEKGEDWYVGGILKTPELLQEWTDYVHTFKLADEAKYATFADTWKHGCEVDCVPIPTAGSPIYSTWSGIGMGRVAYMMRKFPSLVEGLLDAWTNLCIEGHKRLFELGATMVFVCDDHAQKDRGFFSPAQFEHFFEPVYTRLSENAHRHGAKFLLHTDGYLVDEMPNLVRAGVDAAEPLEYEAGNRLGPLKERYGKNIAFIGNVPASEVLCFGTVDDTIHSTKTCIRDAGEGGGLVLAAGANILATSRVANVQAMITTTREYGTYPLDFTRLQDS
ncbi:MAG TPA: uroporphyrinogen decarboxylase family protein [Candidatus Lokiarchaeia archaeon]|nr:uroporphyrinogen decarboxylase family protein [Candidatus Lokiarchaeia archaeon]